MSDNLFFVYAKHEQEKEDVIQAILDYNHDESDRAIEIDNYLSKNDIKYIEREIYKRMR